MRFLLDNNLPPRLARALNELTGQEHEVAPLRDRFKADTKDVDWLSALGRDGAWTIISGDMRITKLPQEREAWLNSGLTAFFLKKQWMTQPFWETAWRLVRAFPDIIKQAELVEPGAGFLLPFGSSGKFEQVRFS